MTREIKFRAWNPDSEHMTYIPDNGILHLGESNFMSNPVWYVSEKTDSGYTSCAYSDRSILMQYTGLKDKNGKEIYEGDIVGRWTNACWPVVFNPKNGGWGFAYENGEIAFNVTATSIKSREIIGNIYENPELLK